MLSCFFGCLSGVLLIMSGRLLVGCGVGCRASIPYYIYIRGAAVGCRLAAVALQVSGVLLMLSSCRGMVCGSCRGGCQLVGIGCASCRGVAAHVGRLVAFLVALRCVGWLSDGRGAALFSVSVLGADVVGVLLMLSDWLPLLVASCRGVGCPPVGCRCSSLSVGRGVSVALGVGICSGCRLVGLFWGCRVLFGALRGALRLTC